MRTPSGAPKDSRPERRGVKPGLLGPRQTSSTTDLHDAARCSSGCDPQRLSGIHLSRGETGWAHKWTPGGAPKNSRPPVSPLPE